MKVCTKCGVEKLEEEFPFKGKAGGPRRAECRECHGIRKREWNRRTGNAALRWAEQRDVPDVLICANELCSKLFKPSDNREKYCSDVCRNRTGRRNYDRKKRTEAKKDKAPKTCRLCGKSGVTFVPRHRLCVDCLPVYRAQKHQQHKAYYKQKHRERQLRKRNAEGFHTDAQWEELKAKCNYTCLCCKKAEPEILLTRDHVVPLIHGGTDNIDNIQPLCHGCNSKKNDKTIDYRGPTC